ncbi:MAG: hypothetical protein OXK72_02400 [Gammaproteobacteria bacterium]|nr:hypothetical protein [Gammaproteobacteria bacterium]
MSMLVIDLYDSGILISDGDRVLADSTSCALIEPGQPIQTGRRAVQQACFRPQDICTRFWSRLPDRSATRHEVPHAEIALHHLQSVWERLDRPDHAVILAVSGMLDRQDLGLVLGICEKLSIPVRGIVSRAALALPGPAPVRTLAWLDVLQTHAILSELQQDHKGVSARAPVTLIPQGLPALNHILAKRITRLFIAKTRFDPMQKPDDERQFIEKLPRWLATLEQEESVVCRLQGTGQALRIRLDRHEVLDMNRPVFEAIALRLAGLFQDRDAVAVVCAPSCRQVFGLEGFLKGLPGCAVLGTEPLQLARQALRYREQITARHAAVHYTTSLEWDRDTSPLTLDIHPGTLAELNNRPTHLLIGDQAWPLDRELCLSARNGAHGLDLDPACGEGGLCRIASSGWLIEVRALHGHAVRLNGNLLTAPRSVQPGDALDIEGHPDALRFIRVCEHETPDV